MSRTVAWIIFVLSTLLFLACVVLFILQRLAIKREKREEAGTAEDDGLDELPIDQSVFDSSVFDPPARDAAAFAVPPQEYDDIYEEPQYEPTVEYAAAPPGVIAILERYDGKITEHEFPADADITVGRSSSSNALVLRDPSVSGRHCVLRVTGHGLELEDLGSSNGTLLGTTRIVSPVYVKPGDHVWVGMTDLLIKSV